ncbi:MAG: membrane integrity-associated transporter subunit PqiC [Rhodospirillales bacterium]|nr:membrane integrity-associated transporter subunit PqiC [Rhodospirillales bacterium]
MNRKFSGFLAIAVIFSLSGCMGSSQPVPPDNYYRLRVDAPTNHTEQPSLPGVLSIAALGGDGLVSARALLFTDQDKSHAVRQHNYHFWADSPTRLLQTELVSYMRQRGIAISVVTPQMRVRADYELVGKIKRLERILGKSSSHVVVELDLAVIRQSDRRLIMGDTYVVEIESRDESVQSSVAALNVALGQVFRSFSGALDQTAQTARR